MPLLNGIFPFKVGTTSYIINAKKDNLIANIEYLKTRVSKVQLLLFGKNYLDELINDDYLKRLNDIRKSSGIEYTIHLPIDLNLMDDSPGNVEKSLNVIGFILDRTSCLGADEYILHIDYSDNFKYKVVELNSENREKFDLILQKIKSKFASCHEKILIENTAYDLSYFSDLIFEHGFNICMDIGHLFVSNLNFDDFVRVFGSKIKEIHLHGFRGKKDHLSLKKIKKDDLDHIMGFLKTYRKSLIIEVFNKKNLMESGKILNKYFGTVGNKGLQPLVSIDSP